MASTIGEAMVIVVPTLAQDQSGNDPIVPAGVGGLVPAPPEAMGQRVDGKC
jgi:hypothetical protein